MMAHHSRPGITSVGRFLASKTLGGARSVSSSSSSFELSTEWIKPSDCDDGQLVVFLHGLLGNKRNVMSFAKSVCNSLGVPGLVVDVRGHGSSQLPSNIASTKSTFSHCVWDLHLTLQKNVPDIYDRELIVMGHSLGGRVTMLHSITEETHRPSHIWLLDTVPGKINGSVHNVLNVAREVATDEKYASLSRKDLTNLLVEQKGFDLGIAMWLASAYDPKSPAGRKFQFDLDVANHLVEEFDNMDFLAWMEEARQKDQVGIHMVHGGANKSWEESGSLDLLRSWEQEHNNPQKFSFHTLPKAGHWVHIDDPKGLLAAVESIHKNEAD
eukprot:CAMPEP_0198143004 /NCGR_PEP_ID=MMETSP1443-20131203/5645_1 /TAXON_ID=186043 /ORGANISM="Entomoneis sp., Strain CCMP2396" /LENGTH=325 /DNA_ID=CAMNT_0043806141 /DNA_START=32 /DNA_END=1009 /DNA_ORIENTATION=-